MSTLKIGLVILLFALQQPRTESPSARIKENPTGIDSYRGILNWVREKDNSHKVFLLHAWVFEFTERNDLSEYSTKNAITDRLGLRRDFERFWKQDTIVSLVQISHFLLWWRTHRRFPQGTHWQRQRCRSPGLYGEYTAILPGLAQCWPAYPYPGWSWRRYEESSFYR